MAQGISWRFGQSDRRFILKFPDRKKVKVKTIDTILCMDVAVQGDILALGAPIVNQCEDDDDDDVFELPTGWSLNEKLRMVRVTYSNRDGDSLTIDEVLNTENDRLHQQLLTIRLSPIITTRIVIMFKSRMYFRLNQLMVLNANVIDDDEYEESDEQSDGYISDVIHPMKSSIDFICCVAFLL
ncbi:hypothetical protein Hanom_Chr17g01568601 [Helianthus anomalus]